MKDRDRFFDAYERGKIDVGGYPFHNTPFMDKKLWEAAFSWIPEELYSRLGLVSAMQTDVNGVPRASAVMARERGIRYLWTGPLWRRHLPRHFSGAAELNHACMA